jgi:hypothetical protein
LALEKVKICIDENGWKFEESIYPFCNQLNIDRNTNSSNFVFNIFMTDLLFINNIQNIVILFHTDSSIHALTH